MAQLSLSLSPLGSSASPSCLRCFLDFRISARFRVARSIISEILRRNDRHRSANCDGCGAKVCLSLSFRPNPRIKDPRQAQRGPINYSHLVAMAFLSMFAFCEEGYALPEDTKATTVKDIREPKDIKEAATASKDVKDAMKAAKEAAKKSKKDCARECGDDYDPVCAHDPADPNVKPRTFATQCTLDVHNCEMGTSKCTEKNFSAFYRIYYVRVFKSLSI